MNKMQEIILDVFNEVALVCDRLGIRYFAIGGTAIGAVRHRGFIPWDDDLDIAIPIEEYQIFLEKAPALLPEHLEIRQPQDMVHNENVFSKVIDSRTTNIETLELDYPDAYKGIFVDVMPMSGIPDGHKTRSFIRKIMRYGSLAYCLPWRFTDRKSTKYKLLWIATLPLRPFITPMQVLDKWHETLIANPFDGANLTGYTWWHRVGDLVFPKEWFDDYVLMPFESTMIRLPIGYHQYLTKQFGDYMTIPPKDQQVTHLGFVDTDNPYRDYQTGRRTIPDECRRKRG